MAHNEVTNFMFYMLNRWSKDEAINIWGKDLGTHIWEKWVNIVRHGCGDNLFFYAQLDITCRQQLVDRANTIYGF